MKSNAGGARRTVKRAQKPMKNEAKVSLNTRAVQAVRKAEEALWGTGVPPHHLLQVLHETLLLRCLKEAGGNYAAAAAMFGPSRQSVQQYANSPLRDARWKPYQQNKRKKRESRA
jgi:hypothetical protein